MDPKGLYSFDQQALDQAGDNLYAFNNGGYWADVAPNSQNELFGQWDEIAGGGLGELGMVANQIGTQFGGFDTTGLGDALRRLLPTE